LLGDFMEGLLLTVVVLLGNRLVAKILG